MNLNSQGFIKFVIIGELLKKIAIVIYRQINFTITTVQVFPGAWTTILVSLDSAGIWNLRTQNLDSWYLGQEL